MKVKECLWIEPDCEAETNEPDLPQLLILILMKTTNF